MQWRKFIPFINKWYSDLSHITLTLYYHNITDWSSSLNKHLWGTHPQSKINFKNILSITTSLINLFKNVHSYIYFHTKRWIYTICIDSEHLSHGRVNAIADYLSYFINIYRMFQWAHNKTTMEGLMQVLMTICRFQNHKGMGVKIS